MFCTKCGAALEENAKFCTKCGQQMNVDAPNTSDATSSPAPNTTQNDTSNPQAAPAQDPTPAPTQAPSQAPAPKKPLNMKLIGGICAAVVLFFIIIIAIAVQPKKINLNKYVTVNFSGYDTLGNATIDVDKEALETALTKALKIKKSKNEDILSIINDVNAYAKLLECYNMYDISLDKTSALCNGDTVTLSFELDNKAAKKKKIKFVGKEKTYTVEGLDEITYINPFESLEVSFSGISPTGTITYTYNGSDNDISQYSFYPDKTNRLRNQDTVTITLNIDEDYYLRKNGARIQSMSQTYTVSGLDSYVNNYNELPAEYLNYAKNEAIDTVAAYVAANYSTDFTVGDIVYAGYIFIGESENIDYHSNYNDLYLLFKREVTDTKERFTSLDIYYPVHYYNIILSEGSCDGEKQNSINGYSYLQNTWFSTNGYTSPLIAYMDLTSNKRNNDDYIIKAGDGFEKYAESTPVTSLSDINDAFASYLSGEALNTINLYIANDYAETSLASNFVYEGMYLLVSKNETDDYSRRNRAYVIYSADISNTDNKFETARVYFPVEFNGLVNLPNNEYLYMENKNIKGQANFPDSWYYTNGYLDTSVMFTELITSNRGDYSYNMSENLRQYGE